MTKTIKIITTAIFLILSTRVALAAAGDLSVKISSPKSPTNQNTFNVNFVALDIDDRPVTVKCFKKGPSDGGFSQFGSDFNLAAGGNSDNCVVDSSIVNSQGTYQFFVRASAAGDPDVDSATVTVDYNTSGPGTPSDYSKEQTNSCTFKLKFKTANDGGKTVKVEFYRSDHTSFAADAGTVFASQAIGSDTTGEISNTVPDCAKTYYYALRAFDSAGNGSGLVGDSFTTTTTTTTTSTASPTTAPVIVAASQVGSGETTVEATPSETEAPIEGSEVIETATPTPQVEGAATSAWWADARWRYLLLIAILALIGYGYKKYQSS